MTFTTLIDAASLRELRGESVVLDCRFDLAQPGAGRRSYLAAHIPGARYADLNGDLASPVTADSGRHPLPSPAALTQFFVSLGIGALMLLAKSKKHYIGLTWADGDKKGGFAMQCDKNDYRGILAGLEDGWRCVVMDVAERSSRSTWTPSSCQPITHLRGSRQSSR